MRFSFPTNSARVAVAVFVPLFLMCFVLATQTQSVPSFAAQLAKNFDYAEFTRFDASSPPKSGIYQSNGFLALTEHGFGKQIVVIPAPVDEAPGNIGDRLSAMEIAAPLFVDSSHKTYSLDDSPAHRNVTYYADRTIYHAGFDEGPDVSLTVYPIYGKPAAVIRLRVERARGLLGVTLHIRGMGFQGFPDKADGTLRYGSPRWPYRLLLGSGSKASLEEGTFQWELGQADEASAVIVLGGTEREAEAVLADVKASRDFLAQATHKAWNKYLASVPLVIPGEPIKFTIGTAEEQETIAAEDLLRS